ncbi:RecF/RecN/SMC protein [Clavulina sp. PMI_390]|nr:RecF/RecN/SMC protein [Clavulina sp. PMI_390]
MHIKTLTIHGFKSYRDQTATEPFSPGHNVVVGRNGSGKSNFFAAIRFVLSDAYASTSREERQSLLHEGLSTTTTLSAYVEIVFDNSDNRFFTGTDEVILRRTIGQKKDDYSLNKKTVTKADVSTLFDTAGFSKSNPYYIVPQGRITSLTNAKDHERLALLKEVAGTKVYEQRRAESLKIMAETDAKRVKIKELLTYIEERLAELEEEKEELKDFQDKDKERRCLEYALYQRELLEVGAQLEEIETNRKDETAQLKGKRTQFTLREKEAESLKGKLADLRVSLSETSVCKDAYSAELEDLVKARTELECVIADLESAGEQGEARRASLEEELEEIQAKIQEVETELMEAVPEWEDRARAEREERSRLDIAQATLDELYSKQGRISRFRTRSERDAYLKKEIAAIDAYAASQEEQESNLQLELEGTQRKMQEYEEKALELDTALEGRKQTLANHAAELAALQKQQAELSEKRKYMWREETKIKQQQDNAQQQLRDAERNLASTMDKDTGNGLAAVSRIADRLQLEGVYGPLYTLFEVTDPVYNTAVELTAGTSLWHVVVDTDATASKLLDVMLKEKTGRVTFMPLNRLKSKEIVFPASNDAQPLIKKLEYDPAHAKAFEQVFGKTAVCEDLTVAASYVRSYGLNTITTDGDKVDRKGALTGGYYDVKRSRMDAIKAVKTWRPKLEELNRQHQEIVEELARVDQEIVLVMGKIQVTTGQQDALLRTRDGHARDAVAYHREKDRLSERAEAFELQLAELERERVAQEARRDAYKKELGTAMAEALTAAEKAACEELAREAEKLKKSLIALSKLKNESAERKNALEVDLHENLKRKREDLRGKLESLGSLATTQGAASLGDVNSRKRELKALRSSVKSLEAKIAELDEEMNRLSAEVDSTNEELEQLQTAQAEDTRGMAKQQKSTERYLAKRELLTTRRDACNKNIRDLGVLPEEAFEKYTSLKLERLVKQLRKVQDGLKKFAHVNKKAFEQYNNFTKQRDQLLKRREDLDKSAGSITELVEILDQRKDEAIERTFKQVSKYFSEVFEKLVPAGRGRLIMQKNIDREPDADDEEEREQGSKIDNYTGVSIKVSFNSKHDEGLRIQQLSGGQKSLVALATVFAIQKCDPAPFYLFDEIDANLDAQYRTAVAAMIHELSASAQFITTTFRPEMLVNADKFYGVLFNNQKVSSIRSITREEAREFVEQEAVAQ